jgi:hypothetical protein
VGIQITLIMRVGSYQHLHDVYLIVSILKANMLLSGISLVRVLRLYALISRLGSPVLPRYNIDLPCCRSVIAKDRGYMVFFSKRVSTQGFSSLLLFVFKHNLLLRRILSYSTETSVSSNALSLFTEYVMERV